MITPQFDIEQDDEFLIIKIRISNIRFSSNCVEININGNMLIFHLSPYYLRLRFDHNLVDDERAIAKFLPGESKILIKAPKANNGEFFNDLDLHSKLLARVNIGSAINETSQKNPLIQEIGNNDDNTSDNKATSEEKIEDIAKLGENFDWEIEQVETDNFDLLNKAYKYGFNNNYSELIGISISNGNDINDLNDPEHTNSIDRIKQRIQRENNVFDDEYYASEYILYKYGQDDDLEINRIKYILNYTPKFVQDYQNWIKEHSNNNKDAIMSIEFNEFEHRQMENYIPRKEYILNPEIVKLNYITILNLLFSFNFESMENEGEHTTESVWTIGKLTPQIAYLDQQLMLPESALEQDSTISAADTIATMSTNRSLLKEVKPDRVRNEKNNSESIIKSAIIVGTRRSLCYPLHRNYDLSMKAWHCVFQTLKAGKRLVIRNLLAIHELFRFHDVYYVYNKCLLDDLCAWFISYGNETIVRSLALELENHLLKFTKDDIEFECISDIDMDTGATSFESVTIRELEILTEQMYQENINKKNTE
ncbi:hypothetical protein RI543_003132 [Arxiozyma heterogenica]|uniref:CS domain-containing protein n=1 Tax=Arxiozyma heterogenica TaxID=278026 RepID=A0AAN7WJ55_9SACH|nr:hypothetical protein RI543_003132 [Kazachstania heterogenica]